MGNRRDGGKANLRPKKRNGAPGVNPGPRFEWRPVQKRPAPDVRPQKPTRKPSSRRRASAADSGWPKNVDVCTVE